MQVEMGRVGNSTWNNERRSAVLEAEVDVLRFDGPIPGECPLGAAANGVTVMNILCRRIAAGGKRCELIGIKCHRILKRDTIDAETRLDARPGDGMTIEEGFLLRNYAGGAASNALLRRHAVLSVGGFDRHLEVSEDWDLWRRLSQAADIIFIPDILSMRRQHQSNVSQQQIKMILGRVRVYRKNLQSLPWHLEHMRWRIRLAMLKCLMRLAAAPIYWSGLRPRARLNALAGRDIFKW